jgi:amidase
MSDLHELSAAEQVSGLRSGDFSSRELVEHYLERIERLDPELSAYVTVTAELARQEADEADARLARGEGAPLLGLPIAIKDLQTTKGVRTTLGSPALPDLVPPADSWTVQLMRGAGAVLLGKTSASELGATCYTENALTGRPAVTPYDTGRYASGSSGGSAVAVAAGLAPVAHGSDSAGSTRTPAATCHLLGLKPSRGLVSSAPASSFFAAGSEGPLARSVADVRLMLDVMAQPWPGDVYGWSAPREDVHPARLTVGVWTATGIDGVATHPEAVAAVERMAALLGDLGHEVRPVPLPAGYDEDVRSALTAWFAGSVATAVQALVPAEGHGLLRPYTRYLLETAKTLSAQDLLLAQGGLARFASQFLAATAGLDLCLTPVTNGPPVPVGHFQAAGPEAIADRMLAWSGFTPWANLTGQPALALPSHLDADGLPHGVQLVGSPRGDGQLLALAAQLEAAGAWTAHHPPCWQQ